MAEFNKGPFTMKDGKPQDSEIFKDELSQESEDRTDKIYFMREVNLAAKKEKAKRKMTESVNPLMEGFGEFEQKLLKTPIF